ncbi:helix-turn-helix transcriptional regulator [Rhodococcus sp. HNM0563]|uniref:TetR/AcrR family transcriptional regulator n=1 Tax=unclassified Rhodococcus (in: high G+C Gram-positive bacteria) TaxID=192944 RepID=UPI00146EAD94|nr:MULTISPECIES: TetR family transcriptional regulator [unclassified Rhodococcus (in: high G+C Gram-positive bacteria)]MCK0089734.1 TetR/AcrR family transcriptional regulator [Rhodococcus sp. F64268]NLU62318.1 helix-turn-helix transcriptional regulator [Rhodococcus sp. HNM0563]
MGSYGDRVRQTLLDSAEELFAEHGIDAVSNRRIAEHAGNSNHSAVNYHFGGRDELIRAMLHRFSEDTHARRRELVSMLAPESGLRDLLSCLIVPFTDQLASMPVPGWRARFLRQMRSVPSVTETVAGAITADPVVDDLIQRVRALLTEIPPSVLTGRSWILGRIVTDLCADYEARLESEKTPPNWTGFANFLIDACAGLLEAPVTSEGDFLGARSSLVWP